MKLLLIIPLLLLIADLSTAQETFTLSQAIDAALEHNHKVQVSEIERAKAERMATRGYAGQMPSLSITSGLDWSYSDLSLTPGSFFQELISPQGVEQGLSPTEISFDGVSATQIHAGLGTQFVIYDGMKGRLRYNLLEAGSELAGLHHRAEMESTILSVTRQYIQVASLQKAIGLKELSLEQSRDRYRIVETRREYGQDSEQQLLQALADLKSDSTEYRDLKLQYENAYRDLHIVIGWERSELISVDETIYKPDLPPIYDELMSSLLENNTALTLRQRRIQNAELEQNIAKADYLPTLTASAQYGYNYQQATDGQFETQEQLGFMGGVNLKIPIFAGGRTRTAMQNAKATVRQEQLRYDESRQQLRSYFENSWHQYLHLENQYATELSNLNVYERNHERAQDSFERGLITGVELRNAQLSLQSARLRISEIEFQLKLTETTLLYLSGELLFIQ